jgi:salicylate biosynthesis isochorismate synthase/menaquinone-specific isochorismate synthase
MTAAKRLELGAVRLVSVTELLAGDHDPSAVVLASREPREPWSCLEQPQRERLALGALGEAVTFDAAGEGRFAELEDRWRELSRDALCDAPDAPPGAGLVALAGFAFDPEGCASRSWDGFGAASLTVPRISLARRGERTWLTCNVAVRAGQHPDAPLEDLLDRLGRLRERPLPLLDPSPTGRFTVQSPMPPAHYEQAVARAVALIAGGELEKIVLAREVQVHAPDAHEPGAILSVLRDGFASCFVYAVGRGEATFIGATPELLVRKEGMRASTVALAGSTRRSADPAVDAHLGESLLRSPKNRHENLLVARRIAKGLSPFSVWVTVAPEPVVIRVANIQHLATPIRAQLSEPVSALTLAGALHPTPAVGGEPEATARRLIPALEGLDRGWYAGALGWTDISGDGEFCVTLRCALLRGELASCYAGCGIVADSEPAAELAETETKLDALLPILSG